MMKKKTTVNKKEYRIKNKGKKKEKIGQFKKLLENFRGMVRMVKGGFKAIGSKIGNYLPQIYRFFSASLGKMWFKAGLAIIFILLIIATTASQKYKSIKEAQKELEKRYMTNEEILKIEKQITYWEDLMVKRNGYRDGYLELAMLNYKLGRILTAKEYMEKAKELDPNNEMVLKLEKIIR